jgi:hypothetical protein
LLGEAELARRITAASNGRDRLTFSAHEQVAILSALVNPPALTSTSSTGTTWFSLRGAITR